MKHHLGIELHVEIDGHHRVFDAHRDDLDLTRSVGVDIDRHDCRTRACSKNQRVEGIGHRLIHRRGRGDHRAQQGVGVVPFVGIVSADIDLDVPRRVRVGLDIDVVQDW